MININETYNIAKGVEMAENCLLKLLNWDCLQEQILRSISPQYITDDT